MRTSGLLFREVLESSGVVGSAARLLRPNRRRFRHPARPARGLDRHRAAPEPVRLEASWMRAIGVVEFGGPEQLRVVDVSEPHPGPGEVRIRVHAAAVNPTDLGFCAGMRRELLRDMPPPHVPGMDAAGMISEVWKGAAWTIGDYVIFVMMRRAPRSALFPYTPLFRSHPGHVG